MTAAEEVSIRLDIDKDHPIEFTPGQDFESQAMRWSYVARNRGRWTAEKDPGEGENSPLFTYLKDDLARIATAKVIEVALPPEIAARTNRCCSMSTQRSQSRHGSMRSTSRAHSSIRARALTSSATVAAAWSRDGASKQ